MASTESGTATNNDGLGSTYAGTQTPDPKAPDGYQKPAVTSDGKKDQKLGNEYDNDSSYGDKESAPETSAGKKSQSTDTDAAGSGVR